MLNKSILEFKCVIVNKIYDSNDFKMYAVDLDYNKHSNIKRTKYGNTTITGNLHDLAYGQEYTVKAKEEYNSKYQSYSYKVINISRERPLTDASTRMFLDEILNSQSQVNTIMEHYPNIIDLVMSGRVKEIDTSKLYGIGDYIIQVIKRKIEENFVFAELIEMFNGLLDLKTLRKLYEKYPSAKKIQNEIKNNPYETLCNLSRVGFKTADGIILQLEDDLNKQDNPPFKFPYDVKTSSQRLEAAIVYLLYENENDGNTRMNILTLKQQCEKLVNNCMVHFKDVVKNEKLFYIYKSKDSKSGNKSSNKVFIALKSTFETEKCISDMLLKGLKCKNVSNKWNIKDTEKYRKINNDIELTDEQFGIFSMVISNNIGILKGNGGSGKTQSTKSVIDMCKDNNISFELFAPTGRASKIASQYTGVKASTVHRGLKYQDSWNFNEDDITNKLNVDIVIVDEFSMVDIYMFRALLCAIDFTRTKLLMIGDNAQLPSVSAGNVYHDLIESNIIPIVSLTKIFRYGKGGVLTVATETRQGKSFIKSKTEPNVFGEDRGYIYLPTIQEKILPQLAKVYKKLLQTNKPEDILVLSSYNKGEYGTIKINNILQKIANPKSDYDNKMEIGNTCYYIDDIVMQTQNNYKALVYEKGKTKYDTEVDRVELITNGEIGKVVEIDSFKEGGFSNHYMVVDYDGIEIIYFKQNVMNELLLAYCISTHKSQGGSAKNIILLTPKAHTYMLNSNLLYVGMTRATKKVFHLGEPNVIERALKKQANFERDTFLQELLREGIKDE